jgi:hypothetical protein
MVSAERVRRRGIRAEEKLSRVPYLSDEEVAQAQAAYESGTNDEIRGLLAAERVRRRGIRAEEKPSRVPYLSDEEVAQAQAAYLEEYYLHGEG